MVKLVVQTSLGKWTLAPMQVSKLNSDSPSIMVGSQSESD